MANFTPSPAELALVTQIFLKADPQKHGILTGDAALKVFGGARLLPTVLGQIWSIADEDNNGWLPKKGVAVAVRLMGWAQKGEKVTQALVNKRRSPSLFYGFLYSTYSIVQPVLYLLSKVYKFLFSNRLPASRCPSLHHLACLY